jgi:hypothetical protein
MKNLIFFKSLPVILMLFIFSSCISIERAIKINDDGSGKEVMTVQYTKDFFDFLRSTAMAFDSVKGKSIADSLFNEDLFAGEIKDKYKKIDGITLKDIKSKFNPDSSLTLKINYTFDNIERLSQTLNSLDKDESSFGKGKTEILFKSEGKKIIFKYKYEIESQNDSSKSLRNSLAVFFKDQKMTFNITFPHSIKSSNAIKTNGKTLTWEFEMDKMMTEGKAIDMEAEINKK